MINSIHDVGIRTLNVKLYSVFIAILPIIKIYKVPFVDFGWGMLLAIAFLPYIFSVCLKKHSKETAAILVCFLYMAIRSLNSIENVILMMAVALHISAAECSFDQRIVREWIIKASLIASIMVIIQRALLFCGVKISPLPTQLLLPEFSDVVTYYLSGTISRVSGFFMEPAHFSQYVIVSLILLLYGGKRRRIKRLIIVIVALICSTSGIGIMLALMLIAFNYLFENESFKRYPLIARAFALLLLGFFALLVLIQIPVFRLSLQRIFGTVDSYNAIAGRLVFTQRYLGRLNGASLFFGVGAVAIDDYLVGVVSILYQFGIVGLALLLFVLLVLFKNGTNASRSIVIVYFILLLSASLANSLSMIFYLVLANGFRRSRNLD